MKTEGAYQLNSNLNLGLRLCVLALTFVPQDLAETTGTSAALQAAISAVVVRQT